MSTHPSRSLMKLFKLLSQGRTTSQAVRAMATPRPIPGWRPSTPAVGGRALEELLRQHSAIAIHFWATWDGHDPGMDQSIREIAERFAGRVLFLSADIDLEENRDLCRHFRIANIPTLGVLRSGRNPTLIVGYRDPEHLANEIETRLNEPEKRPWWSFGRSGNARLNESIQQTEGTA